jgi:hypothetical protein
LFDTAGKGVSAASKAASPVFGFGSSVLDLTSNVYANQKAKEQYDREVQLMKEQEEQRREEQRLAIVRARGEQKLQLALQLSAERRKQQETVMWAIGAVAVGVSGFFIFKALRSGTPVKR